jgi:hypothetical protein
MIDIAIRLLREELYSFIRNVKGDDFVIVDVDNIGCY